MRQRLAALIIAGLLALGVTGCLPSDAEEEASSAQQTTAVATPDWEEVKAQSRTIGYRELFRNNEQYVGQRFYFRGQIVQVIEHGANTYDFRVDVTPDSLDSAIVYLAGYTGQRLLEDDRIAFVGAAAGLQRYESIFGQHITIPRLKAVVVRLLTGTGAGATEHPPGPTASPTPYPTPAPLVGGQRTTRPILSTGTTVAGILVADNVLEHYDDGTWPPSKMAGQRREIAGQVREVLRVGNTSVALLGQSRRSVVACVAPEGRSALSGISAGRPASVVGTVQSYMDVWVPSPRAPSTRRTFKALVLQDCLRAVH